MSETTNLKLLKHDNPETNTEKFDIENYLNGNFDKIDEHAGEVNANISNINSKNEEQDTSIEQLQENTETSNNKIAKLETELKEMQEDFYQASVRGQASGEYIHVEDSSNCRCRIGIGGNQEQETRSGKNLSKVEKISTINGGYINSSCGILATIESGKTYTISFNCSNKYSGTNAIYVRVPNGNAYEGQAVLNYSSGNRISKTFTASMSGELSLSASLGTDFEDILYDIQLEEGSIATSFEAYGAMPSPDYPSSIVAVGSNVNIFDKDNMTIGKIWSGATLLDSDVGNASPKIPVAAGKTYIRNVGYSSNYIIKEDNSVVDIQGGTNAITMPENAKYWVFNIPKDINIDTIKAEKGTVATPWSQHGQGCVKVTKCNKNLINIEEIEWGTYYIATGALGTSFNWGTIKVKALGNTKYYLSGNKVSNNTACIILLDKNKEFIKLVDGYTNTHLITTTNDTCYIGISIPKYIDGSADDTTTIMLEEKEVLTSYKEHQEQSYIMPTQAEMLEGDYFDFDNEEEVHTWNKSIIKGTDLTSVNCSIEVKTKTVQCNLINILTNGLAVNENKIKCNLFCSKYGDTSDTEHIRNGSASYPNNLVCNILKSNLTSYDLEGVQKFFNEKNLNIWYKLATPTRLVFTDEQKAVSKELNNARTYKNVTNITTDSIAILDLDYAKDLETLLKSTSEEV